MKFFASICRRSRLSTVCWLAFFSVPPWIWLWKPTFRPATPSPFKLTAPQMQFQTVKHMWCWYFSSNLWVCVCVQVFFLLLDFLWPLHSGCALFGTEQLRLLPIKKTAKFVVLNNLKLWQCESNAPRSSSSQWSMPIFTIYILFAFVANIKSAVSKLFFRSLQSNRFFFCYSASSSTSSFSPSRSDQLFILKSKSSLWFMLLTTTVRMYGCTPRHKQIVLWCNMQWWGSIKVYSWFEVANKIKRQSKESLKYSIVFDRSCIIW